jgi:hypothetical protein
MAQGETPREFEYEIAQRPMRAIDGNHLAIMDGAKNCAVEVIGMHRFLAAPSRGLIENQNINVAFSLREKKSFREARGLHFQASHGPGSKSSEPPAACHPLKPARTFIPAVDHP